MPSEGTLLPAAERLDLLRLTDLTGDAEGARRFSGLLSVLEVVWLCVVLPGVAESATTWEVGPLSGMLVSTGGRIPTFWLEPTLSSSLIGGVGVGFASIGF